MSLPDQVLALVDVAVEENTFSLDAVKGVQRLRSEHADNVIRIEEMQKSIDELEERAESWEKQFQVERGRFNELQLKMDEYAKREKELAEREFECRVGEMRAVEMNQRLIDMKDLVGMVFRNPVLKRTVTEPVMVPPPSFDSGSGYGLQCGHVESHTRTEEEEEV
jgi:hypothetical protein